MPDRGFRWTFFTGIRRFCRRLKPPWPIESHPAPLRSAWLATHRRWAAAVFLLSLAYATTAQEALRYSLAGQAASEARKQALANENFNAKLGPVGIRFGAALGIEATDNVRNTADDPEADLIFRPQWNTFARWRVTDKNSLSLGLGIGYEKHINATDYDRLFISPDTDLSFDVYAGDFLINFHERFDYSSDVTLNPTVSGTGSLPRFENTIGVRTVWDLNKTFISAGYDHQNYISTESLYDYETHSSELFTAAVGFQLRPTLQAGFEAGGGLLDYTQPLSQDNQHVSIGPFVSAQFSEYSSFRFSFGYVYYYLDAYGLTNAASNMDAFYFAGSFSQRVSRLLTHNLSLGHSLQPQIGSQQGTGIQNLWQVNYSAAWNILLKTGVNTSLSYEHGSYSGFYGEIYDRFGAGITLSRALTKKASGSVGYQFYLRNSNLSSGDYAQNRLVLNFGYTF
jgi:hypothetical protein